MTSAVDPKIRAHEHRVLVVGAGPVGLTVALELRRRGVDVTVVDRLARPAPYAKAVGIQPRTLEVWDAMGVLRQALDAAVHDAGPARLRQRRAGRPARPRAAARRAVRLRALPQYETERVLPSALAELGRPGRTRHRAGRLRAGRRRRDRDRSRARRRADGRARATSSAATAPTAASARGSGCRFEGDAFPERVHARRRRGGLGPAAGLRRPRRCTRTRRQTDDLLVCIPLPGPRPLPDVDARTRRAGHRRRRPATGRSTGWRAAGRPELRHIQAVLDRLSPRAHDRVPPALVVGVPDQPPAGGPVRRSAGSSSRATPRTSTRRPARRA